MIELPSGWAKCKLGDFLFLRNGYAFKSKDFGPEGIPVIRISDINDGKVTTEKATRVSIDKANENFIIDKGDVLIAMSGATTGKFGKYDSDEVALLNQRVGILKPIIPAISKEFIFHLIANLKSEVVERAYGGAQPNISSKLIESIETFLPPLNEQKRMVEKLDRLFANLDSLKTRLDHIPELLKQFRQSVLTQAVTGKLTKEWRERNKYNFEDTEKFIQKRRKNYYEKKLAEARKNGEKKPKKLDQSAFEYFAYSDGYALPENWGLVNLKNVADIITDGEHATPKRTEAGYYLLSARNVLNGSLSFKKVDHVPLNEFERIKKRCYPEYKDILISCSGTIGRVCSVPKGLEFVMVRSVALIKIQSNTELSGFMEIALQSRLVQHQIESLQKATAQANLFIGPIGRIVIPLPPLEEQQEIVRRVEALFAIADSLEERYENLKAQIEHLPQAILAKAFRGELVPQDPNDEPAEELLDRIKAEREGKPAKRKIGKQVEIGF